MAGPVWAGTGGRGGDGRKQEVSGTCAENLYKSAAQYKSSLRRFPGCRDCKRASLWL